jgi:di/tricarboxylate transporter
LPPFPDSHALFAMLATALALWLFTRDRLPLEASGLAVLALLVIVFQLFPYQTDDAALTPRLLLEGFGNEALIAVCLLMIIGKGLETTGALQPLAVWLARLWMAEPRIASLVTMILAASMSAFANNTPVVVMLLPMLVGVAVRNRLPPSAILMPVGFAALIGGMATTIGSSSSLLIVSLAEAQGPESLSFGMFSFLLPAVIAGGIGILYLWLVAPRLLPPRQPLMTDTSPRVFNAAFHVNDDSRCCGMSFAECLALTANRMRVDRIQRGRGLTVAKLPSLRLQAGDQLTVRDTPERLKEFEKQIGATLHDEFGATGIHKLPPDDAELEHLAEIVVTRGAMLHRSTLAATRFTQRTGLLPLALHRARSAEGEEITSHIGLVPLRAGDILLVQGTQRRLEELKRTGNALVLDGTTDLPRTQRAELAFLILGLVVLAAALDYLPISVSALLGVGAMLATRCLTPKDAAQALSIPVIVVIVTSLALGVALNETQGSAWLARSFVAVFDALPTPVILSVLMLAMAVLTCFVSNIAAGILATPIAIQIAQGLGASPEAFVVAVIFGANMSFATPFGYQTNLLVLTAGGYKFSDFMRAGLPLMLVMWLVLSLVLPLYFEL